MTTARRVGAEPKRITDAKQIDALTKGVLHSGGGIEGSTQMGSVQTAAEALQKAETEVVPGKGRSEGGSAAVR
jgi:hypothetical protein